jgi:hypothetical protein
MKSNKKTIQEYIRKIVKSYLAEEEKEGGEEGGGENPFDAGDEGGEEGGGEAAGGAPPPSEPAGGEGGEEEEKTDSKKGGQPQGVPVKFDVNKVKKYNSAKFLGDEGVLKSISKKGLVVTVQPDNVDVLVNFDDISEQVKKFFKKSR